MKVIRYYSVWIIMIMTCYVLIDDITLILIINICVVYNVFIILCDNLNFIPYTN